MFMLSVSFILKPWFTVKIKLFLRFLHVSVLYFNMEPLQALSGLETFSTYTVTCLMLASHRKYNLHVWHLYTLIK